MALSATALNPALNVVRDSISVLFNTFEMSPNLSEAKMKLTDEPVSGLHMSRTNNITQHTTVIPSIAVTEIFSK